MKQTALVAGCVLGLGLLICGWREYRHRGLAQQWAAREQMLSEQGEFLKARQQELVLQSEEHASEREAMKIEISSLRDRATNLTAQRDHLRAEGERQSSMAREKTKALEKAEQDLQAIRHELLLQSAVPRQLEAELERAGTRIEELEAELDKQSAIQAMHPNQHTVEGISGDGSVIALAGKLDNSTNLPYPVRLCRRNDHLLDGWINRIEEGILIVHVTVWKVPSSALVKGEKVFILPVRNHDSDP